MSLRLSRAGSADAGLLSRLYIRCWRETYAGLLPDGLLAGLDEGDHHSPAAWRRMLAPGDPWRETWIVRLAGEPAGLLRLGAADRPELGFPGEIEKIYLLTGAQGRGHGRALMAWAADRLAGHGLAPVHCWVLAVNTAAHAFYERLGGRRIGEQTVFTYEGEDIVEVAYGFADGIAGMWEGADDGRTG